MTLYFYLLPVVLLAGALAYTFMMQAGVRKGLAEGRAGELFHDAYAAYFDALLPNESLIGVWQGQAYIKPVESVGDMAGSVARRVGLGMIGMTTFTPIVYVGITTLGRVLVSEEYSEMGSRNNFKVVAAFPPGAQLAVGPAAYEHQGAAPNNPYSLSAPLELVRFISTEQQYLAWVNGAGALTGAADFVSITSVLPITAKHAASIWQAANQPRAAA